MNFDYSKMTYEDSLKIGADDAPVKVVEYINLRCPDSKNYEENVTPYLKDLIAEGQVQRILKHFDKKKYPLEVGSVLNQYLNYDTPEETYAVIQQLFKEQNIWGSERLSQIPHIAKEYGLELQAKNKDQAKNIDAEVAAANIEMIPTVFVGETAFIETVNLEEFKAEVEKQLN